MSGCYFVVAACAACRKAVACNPHKVPSLRLNSAGKPDPNGQREPLCLSCFHKWNEVHRTSKGLKPIAVQPGAYDPAPEVTA